MPLSKRSTAYSCPSRARAVALGLQRKPFSDRHYLVLGAGLGDAWLDAGAFDSLLEGLDEYEVARRLRQAGLIDLVVPTFKAFRRSVNWAMSIAAWRDRHTNIPNVDTYIRAVAELRIGEEKGLPPVELLDLLPCALEANALTVKLSPEQWAEVLRDAAKRVSRLRGFLPLVQTAVRVAIRTSGLDPNGICDPRIAASLQIVESGPDFIAAAEFLAVEEKLQLVQAKANAAEDVVLQAKRIVCDQLCEARQSGRRKNCKARQSSSVTEVFHDCLARLVQEQRGAAEDLLFADRDRLLAKVVRKLAPTAAIRSGLVDGQSADEALAQRLRAIELPEFVLLADCVLHSDTVESAAARWLTFAQSQPRATQAKKCDRSRPSSGVEKWKNS